jgi:hypothetical protein
MRSALTGALAAALLGACVPALPAGSLGGPTGAGGTAGALSAAGMGGSIGPDASAAGAAGAAPEPYLFAANIANVNVPRTLVVDSRYVYWLDTGQGSVRKAPVEGGSVVTLSSNGTRQGDDWIAVDSENVYWSVTTSRIFKTAIEGGAETTVVPFRDGRGTIWQFAVNRDALFWIEGSGVGNDSVMRVGKDGGTPTQLAAIENPTAIAVDEQSVYWAEAPSVGTCPTLDCQSVNKVAGSGGQAVVLAPSGGVVSSLTFDATHVYWLSDARTVTRVSKHGGAAESVRGPADATTFAVDTSGVYWSDWNGSVWVAMPGAPSLRIIAQSSFARGMALGANSVYWIAQGSIYRMPK